MAARGPAIVAPVSNLINSRRLILIAFCKPSDKARYHTPITVAWGVGTVEMPARQSWVITSGHQVRLHQVCFTPGNGCWWRALARGLFEHLVGAHEQGRWNFDAQCLGSLNVDDEFDLCDLLHRQV